MIVCAVTHKSFHFREMVCVCIAGQDPLIEVGCFIVEHVRAMQVIIPKDTKIEDIKEFFQIEVMTSSPSPNFFQIEDIVF